MLIRAIKREFIQPQFIRFLVVGGTAATVNFFSRILLGFLMPYAASIVVAYGFGMATAYLLSKFFVFEKPAHGYRKQIAYFVTVNLLAVVQTLCISLLFAHWILPAVGIVDSRFWLGNLIGLIVPAFTSYLGHKYFSFRPV